MQACQDRLHRLEEVLKKKDGALLSTKMVLKFKERTIGMLEKKIKSGSSELQPDDKDALIVGYRAPFPKESYVCS